MFFHVVYWFIKTGLYFRSNLTLAGSEVSGFSLASSFGSETIGAEVEINIHKQSLIICSFLARLGYWIEQ